MKLTFEQIKQITVGAAYVEENEVGVGFHRFTKEQEDAYKSYSDDFYKKCFAPAGVRIELVTDSEWLDLSVEITPSSRSFFSHPIYVNKNLIGELAEKTNNGIFSQKFPLGTGEKTVAIYFPWTVHSRLIGLSLDDGAKVEPVKKDHRMIMFGDSITQGYSASNPALSYASQVADALCANAINKGIGGEVFFPTLSMLPDECNPDIITVAYGTNDWSRGNLAVFEENSNAFFKNLSTLYPNAKIFALAPTWRSNYEKKDRGYDFSHIAEHYINISKTISNFTFQ